MLAFGSVLNRFDLCMAFLPHITSASATARGGTSILGLCIARPSSSTAHAALGLRCGRFQLTLALRATRSLLPSLGSRCEAAKGEKAWVNPVSICWGLRKNEKARNLFASSNSRCSIARRCQKLLHLMLFLTKYILYVVLHPVSLSLWHHPLRCFEPSPICFINLNSSPANKKNWSVTLHLGHLSQLAKLFSVPYKFLLLGISGISV